MGLFKNIFGRHQPAPPYEIHPKDSDLVTSDDIAWWNSLTLKDCQGFEQEDNLFRLAVFTKHREKDGLSAEEAAKKAKYTFPIYYGTLSGRDNDKHLITDEDAKLPYVLKDRVNRAVMRGRINKEAIAQASSMNALIRSLIRSGEI